MNTVKKTGLNGKAITACMTILHEDTSVLEMVATLEEYRRKGVATATINQALLDLRQKGVKTISLRAETDGIQVYKRLGFKECFVRTIAAYNWKETNINSCPCRIETDRIDKAKAIFNHLVFCFFLH